MYFCERSQHAVMPFEILQRIRYRQPLVHCISNYVSANDCANLLLAAGASPMMADAPEEMEEISTLCDAHVFNLGIPSAQRFHAMEISAMAACRMARPLVLDPVGVGSSAFRWKAANRLLESFPFAVIRGNASEITALANGATAQRGVDAEAALEASVQDVYTLARKTGAIVALTGDVDILSDGQRLYRVYNGCSMMRAVTGAGCMLSALIGAAVAVYPQDLLEATLAAVCTMGVCGERAFARMRAQDGNAAFRTGMIDALYRLRPEELGEEARYEVE